MTKNNLIKGVTLNDCYDFVDSGETIMPKELEVYFDLMDKVRSMHYRVGDFGTKESIVKHFIKVEGLSRHLSEKVYYDGLEYFHGSQRLSQQAQRNVYADKIDRQIAICEPFTKEVKDAKAIVSMIMDAWKARGLDKEQAPVIPEDWLKKTWNLYTTSALEAGFEPADKPTLIKQIENYPELTPKEKSLILREAGIDDLILFPDDTKNPRKEG